MNFLCTVFFICPVLKCTIITILYSYDEGVNMPITKLNESLVTLQENYAEHKKTNEDKNQKILKFL